MVLVRLSRIRLALELVLVVIEFFGKGVSKIRMDCFLLYLLRFYYETQTYWSEVVDELGEFPIDVEYVLEELLSKWRKKEKFPRNLEESKESVDKMERQYQNKVKLYTKLQKVYILYCF